MHRSLKHDHVNECGINDRNVVGRDALIASWVSALCWVAGAMAACLVTAWIRSLPFGIWPICFACVAVAIGGLFCVLGEGDTKRGIRTTIISLVILTVLPIAGLKFSTLSGLIVVGVTTISVVAASAIFLQRMRVQIPARVAVQANRES